MSPFYVRTEAPGKLGEEKGNTVESRRFYSPPRWGSRRSWGSSRDARVDRRAFKQATQVRSADYSGHLDLAQSQDSSKSCINGKIRTDNKLGKHGITMLTIK